MKTTITFFFSAPSPSTDQIAQLLAVAGIGNFNYTAFSEGQFTWEFTANRLLTSAEKTALQQSIVQSLIRVTDEA